MDGKEIKDDNRCVSCGDIIPEGRQVCPTCENTGGRNCRDLFRRIAEEYKGSIAETEDKVMIQSKNEIASYYQGGGVCKKDTVLCIVYIWQDSGGRWSLGAEEKTFAILGGCSGFVFTEQMMRELLMRYNFQKKEKEYTLFDLIKE